MKKFKNIKDLAAYLNSPQGKSMIIKQTNLVEIINREVHRLYRYLIEEMDKHYASFSPEHYHRTGAWYESIQVHPVRQVGDAFVAKITFVDEFAFHPSVVPGGEDGYVPWLMEVGWKDRSHSTPHFDGFRGTHYIKKAVERWNRDNRLGLTVRVYRGNERYL